MNERERIASQLRTHLGTVRQLRQMAAADSTLARRRQRIKAWQAQRLRDTYPDLLASERYRPAALFFLDELYGTKDFTRRDADIERIVPTMQKLLPAGALQSFAWAIELDALSERLDAACADALPAEVALQDQMPLTQDVYAAAYVAGSTRIDRERQLELIGAIGRLLDRLVHKPLVRGALNMMEGPARLAGLERLHQFLASGFAAFSHMRGADHFLATVMQREKALMEELFRSVPSRL